MVKKSRMKLSIAVIFAALLIFTGPLTEVVKAVTIYIEGEKISSDVEPEIRSGRTFVPLRVISEHMGESVSWNGKTRTVSLVSGEREMEVKIGDPLIKVFINSKLQDSFKIESAPYIKQDRTMVPIRAISEFFGKNVDWDDATKSVFVGQKPNLIQIDQNNLNKLKDLAGKIPRSQVEINNFNTNVKITAADFGMIKIFEARLNEVIPGNYETYFVSDRSNEMAGFSSYLFIERDTGKAYYSLLGSIFSLPENRVVHAGDAFKLLTGVEEGTVFRSGVEMTEIFRALMMQEGKAHKDDNLESVVYLKGDHLEFDLWKMNGSSRELVERFAVKDNVITRAKTGQVLFQNDMYINRPEKVITEDNCGPELVKILQHLKMGPKADFYEVMDVKYIPYSDFSEVDRRVGYAVVIRSESAPNVPKDETYFINETGTVVMKYDEEMDAYYYLYGEYVPFG